MAKITERLNEPDAFEIIREQIAGILDLEMENQYQMAVTDGDPVAEDYKVTTYIENDEPLAAGSDLNIFPIVNVWLDQTRNESGSAKVNTTKETATYRIDLYAIGNYDGKFAGRKASLKAWKLARCVRRILKSDAYTYLLLRGLVSGTEIKSMEGGAPNMADSAVKVSQVRITLDVTFDQNAPRTTGEILEIIPVTILDDLGQIVVN
ncbi:MAG: hypothetical protein KBT02_00205 [Treponema sp.]|nr:hypothetical protein [Candidatus Treponema caballi]